MKAGRSVSWRRAGVCGGGGELARVRAVQRVRMAAAAADGMSNVATLRKEYSAQGIEDEDVGLHGDAQDPFALFRLWFQQAVDAQVHEPNAMCLATATKNGVPSARYVLLKGFDERGFCWYTNYGSRKAAELEENPHAALCFWWGEMERSVRIEGRVARVDPAESQQYFDSRPASARLGAIASDQSRPIESRAALDQKFENLTRTFLDENGAEKVKIERPALWGGFRLEPRVFEFWKGRESRVHDRIVFTHSGTGWRVERLQP
ncbi:Pyridoxine/pyridoxamine 5'-phosphate oxidase [Porphyridium purpureum]|uniref:Pyridoxine-5'-phosphate oxidase n=1 Tax=Porphyridium purpureum TaxID=35688 RepID=A0A5J4Z515_PORPP|nr:Pyridoxine/pyridoxamine 5'-phosphate oxidase [Porphyridium purpureum]|eukprot:POR7392..scf295_1